MPIHHAPLTADFRWKRTMKQLWLLLAIAIPLQSIDAQEMKNDPTVEQFRAHQQLWLSKLLQPYDAGVATVHYKELGGWAEEMLACSDVDTARQGWYFETRSVTNLRQIMRLQDFIKRHNLWD